MSEAKEDVNMRARFAGQAMAALLCRPAFDSTAESKATERPEILFIDNDGSIGWNAGGKFDGSADFITQIARLSVEAADAVIAALKKKRRKA